MESYVVMYVDPHTNEEFREVQVLYSAEEVEEIRTNLQKQYINVEIITKEEANELGIEY